MEKKFERVWCRRCSKRIKILPALRLEKAYGYNSVDGHYSTPVMQNVADCPSCGNAIYFL